MRKRIELTNNAGASIHINPDHIVAIRPAGDKPQGPATILLVTGVEWSVKETVDQVLEKIDSQDWGGPTDSPAAD
jgi:uncharacterized protein YlzI (FlbEa/FlbD family)